MAPPSWRPYPTVHELRQHLDGVYRPFERPNMSDVCEGWGDPAKPCPAEGRTVLRRPARWVHDGRLLCGQCKRLDEAERAGESVRVAGLDPEIRAAVVDGFTHGFVRHEVPVLGATVDVLAVAGRGMEAFEIKSNADSVRRLPRQVEAYDQIFPRCWLAVGSRLRAKAVPLLPVHWGVAVHDGEVLHVERDALPNPMLDLRSTMNLVTGRQSLVEMARRAGPTETPLSKMYVHELREHVATTMPREKVLAEVAAFMVRWVS